MQMLYLDPWELLPLFKLFLRRFFNKEPDEPDFPEGSNCFIVKVISSIGPYDPVHSKLHKVVYELVKKRSICCKKDCMLFVSFLNVSDCLQYVRVEQTFSEEVQAETTGSVETALVDDFFEELKVHVLLTFFSWAVGTR